MQCWADITIRNGQSALGVGIDTPTHTMWSPSPNLWLKNHWPIRNGIMIDYSCVWDCTLYLNWRTVFESVSKKRSAIWRSFTGNVTLILLLSPTTSLDANQQTPSQSTHRLRHAFNVMRFSKAFESAGREISVALWANQYYSGQALFQPTLDQNLKLHGLSLLAIPGCPDEEWSNNSDPVAASLTSSRRTRDQDILFAAGIPLHSHQCNASALLLHVSLRWLPYKVAPNHDYAF